MRTRAGSDLRSKSNKVARFGWAAAALLGLATVLPARAAVAPRLGALDDGARVSLAGNVSPRLKFAKDLGPAQQDQQLHLSLRFGLSAAQQSSLTTLLTQLQDPASPKYHQWLTPEQFGAQFGPAASDVAALTAWLESKGFAVSGTAGGRQSLEFTGTVAQAQAAFGTEIHRVQVQGGSTWPTSRPRLFRPAWAGW